MSEEKVVKLVTNTLTTALTAVVPTIMNGNKEMIVDVVKEVVKKDTTTNNNRDTTTNINPQVENILNIPVALFLLIFYML